MFARNIVPDYFCYLMFFYVNDVCKWTDSLNDIIILISVLHTWALRISVNIGDNVEGQMIIETNQRETVNMSVDPIRHGGNLVACQQQLHALMHMGV